MPRYTTILLSAAAALMLVLSAGSPAPRAGMPPGCESRCGNMSVPFPFGIGIGPSHCYLPGFNLRCDRSSNPPRLLLGNSTLQVVEEIDASYPKLTVVHAGDIETDGAGRGTVGGSVLGDRQGTPYTLSDGNQLILVGCNARATLRNGNITMGGCSSMCYDGGGASYLPSRLASSMLCTGIGCCQAPIDVRREVLAGSGQLVPITSYDVQLDSFGWNRTEALQWPPRVFVAREGWFAPWRISHRAMAVPFWLDWEVIISPYDDTSLPAGECPDDAARTVCRSKHADCTRLERGGFICSCSRGYHGNPYIANGCKANCSMWCGNMSVPYPFGIGPPTCYLPAGFNLTCDTSRHPPQLMLGTFQVMDISLSNNTMRVTNTDTVLELYGGIGISRSWESLSMWDEVPYSLSTSNELILMGCGVQAVLFGTGKPAILSGCSSFCALNDNGTYMVDDDNDQYCYSMGCCQARISMSMDGMPSESWIGRMDSNTAWDETSRRSYAIIAEEGWFHKRHVAAELLRSTKLEGSRAPSLKVPIVLDWEVLQLQSAVSRPRGNASSQQQQYLKCPGICRSKNSFCKPRIRGYACHCSDGYDGNPYLIDGCKGGRKYFKGMSAAIGVASGTAIVLLVLMSFFISQKLKHRRAQMMKRKFFEQNRGQLLQQLVSQRADIAERMIISLQELEMATNNFDKACELGGGGHGVVYKGILSDLQVVAIKKPKKVIQREIDEFINEVAILSQINHRNVVKLHGCCLETEVPMLVYEFISNGTLHGHLHVQGPKSLSWDNRLRIAIETAKSIAYLHSTASVPIIHRDIKSVNILLDDTLTAKVADFGASRYVPMDKSGLTTMVQGTIGYMDPMYFCTGRLTQKSDVYGFGVLLVELLTRQKPFAYMSSEGDGLVAHFSALFVQSELKQILNPQVIEEGGKGVDEVAALAVACVKLSGEDRPTMRQVELILESVQSPNHLANVVAAQYDEVGTPVVVQNGRSCEESTRQYSMEQAFEISTTYPR